MTGKRRREPRTLLEQRIWQRRMTLDEFAQYAEQFARERGETGTVSRRHLDRLVAGHGPNGAPLGRPEQATARLLEGIFGDSIDALLSAPPSEQHGDGERELRDRLQSARRLDSGVLDFLDRQLDGIRLLDRQLGAAIVHDEVLTKIRQVDGLRRHSTMPANRARLAAVLAELGTLAGWQSLDMGDLGESWEHYEAARTVAQEAGNPAYVAHTAGEHAFVLVDLGETGSAVELLGEVRRRTRRRTDALLRSWLAAAHGEVLAAHGEAGSSLRAFDDADALLPAEATEAGGPYVALDPVHLARWRGHALARVGAAEAVDVLRAALAQLDPTFTRAAAGLHVDLATAYAAQREPDRARAHLDIAQATADTIGSRRQRRRIDRLTATRLTGTE